MGGGGFHSVRGNQENFKYSVFSSFPSLHQNKVLTLSRDLFLPRFLVCYQGYCFGPMYNWFFSTQVSLRPFTTPWSSPQPTALLTCQGVTVSTYHSARLLKIEPFLSSFPLVKETEDGNKMDLGHPAWTAVFLLRNGQDAAAYLGARRFYNLYVAHLAGKAGIVTKAALEPANC